MVGYSDILDLRLMPPSEVNVLLTSRIMSSVFGEGVRSRKGPTPFGDPPGSSP